MIFIPLEQRRPARSAIRARFEIERIRAREVLIVRLESQDGAGDARQINGIAAQLGVVGSRTCGIARNAGGVTARAGRVGEAPTDSAITPGDGTQTGLDRPAGRETGFEGHRRAVACQGRLGGTSNEERCERKAAKPPRSSSSPQRPMTRDAQPVPSKHLECHVWAPCYSEFSRVFLKVPR